LREINEPLATVDVDITGPIPYTFNERTVKRLKEIGAFDVSSVLQKPLIDQSQFERTLLRGVHWFANAQFEKERENELLCLITCLETFLTPEDGNPIGTAIAEGVAFLLETDVDSRKRMKKTVQKLYRLRSGVSHGGNKAVSDADLDDLQCITKNFVTKMIQFRNKVTSQKQLLEKLELSFRTLRKQYLGIFCGLGISRGSRWRELAAA